MSKESSGLRPPPRPPRWVDTVHEVARTYDVPPWLIDPSIRHPRFARLRWLLRRWLRP